MKKLHKGICRSCGKEKTCNRANICVICGVLFGVTSKSIDKPATGHWLFRSPPAWKVLTTRQKMLGVTFWLSLGMVTPLVLKLALELMN